MTRPILRATYRPIINDPVASGYEGAKALHTVRRTDLEAIWQRGWSSPGQQLGARMYVLAKEADAIGGDVARALGTAALEGILSGPAHATGVQRAWSERWSPGSGSDRARPFEAAVKHQDDLVMPSWTLRQAMDRRSASSSPDSEQHWDSVVLAQLDAALRMGVPMAARRYAALLYGTICRREAKVLLSTLDAELGKVRAYVQGGNPVRPGLWETLLFHPGVFGEGGAGHFAAVDERIACRMERLHAAGGEKDRQQLDHDLKMTFDRRLGVGGLAALLRKVLQQPDRAVQVGTTEVPELRPRATTRATTTRATAGGGRSAASRRATTARASASKGASNADGASGAKGASGGKGSGRSKAKGTPSGPAL